MYVYFYGIYYTLSTTNGGAAPTHFFAILWKHREPEVN